MATSRNCSGENKLKSTPKLRIARPSDDLDALLTFYRDGLGLSLLARFEDHDGFDGIVLGAPQSIYHLEFTCKRGEIAGRAPGHEHLIVFYFADRASHEAAVMKMRDAGFAATASANPYWDKAGLTFEDPDGYRVVLHDGDWVR